MRLKFNGVGAFLGRVDGESLVSFWADDPDLVNFDPQQLVRVNLDRTLAKLVAGDGDVARLQIGTTDLRLPLHTTSARTVGCVYLFQRFFKAVGQGKIPWPPQPDDGREYEWQMTYHWAGKDKPVQPGDGVWFSGFHSKVVSAPPGGPITLDLWDEGRSFIDPPKQKAIALADFNNPALFEKINDSRERDTTAIDQNLLAGQEGSLFIATSYATSTLGLSIIKHPKSAGR